MKKRSLIAIGVAVAILVIAGIGVVGVALMPRNWHARHEALGRPATVRDVVGAWKYDDEHSGVVVTMSFRSDGTFRQTVTNVRPPGLGKAITQEGRWELQPYGLVLYNSLRFEEERWAVDSWIRWDVGASALRLGQAAIYGGTVPDPDDYRELVRINLPAATAPTPTPVRGATSSGDHWMNFKGARTFLEDA